MQTTDFREAFAFNIGSSFVLLSQVHQRLCKPAGLAILRNDDIAVCCEDQIHVWTHGGKSVTGFGKGFFGNCTSIAVNSENHLVVADVAKHCITMHTYVCGDVVCSFGLLRLITRKYETSKPLIYLINSFLLSSVFIFCLQWLRTFHLELNSPAGNKPTLFKPIPPWEQVLTLPATFIGKLEC